MSAENNTRASPLKDQPYHTQPSHRFFLIHILASTRSENDRRTLKPTHISMAKDKSKSQFGPGQKHLYSRASYLYQAATYLAIARNGPFREQNKTSSQDSSSMNLRTELPMSQNDSQQALAQGDGNDGVNSRKTTEPNASKFPSLSRRMIEHLRHVSLKAQIRLSPAIKHSICKRCNHLLVPGSSTTYIENRSKGGRKRHADVLVVTCNACGTEKRFPTGLQRQSRKTERNPKEPK